MRRFLAGLVVTTVVGCSPGSYRTSNGLPPAVGAPTAAVFSTELAGPHTYLAPMPTAVVILKPDDMARNRAFCEAFAKLPTAEEARARSVVAPNLILTRWLTQLGEVPPDRVRDCDYLVGTYDYVRAARLVASLRTTGATPSGAGPFFAMIVPDGSGLHVVAVDGSRYATDNFDQFVSSWNDAIGRAQAQLSSEPDRPGLVRSTFNLVSAVLRTVFGGMAGLIEGTIGGL